MNGKVHVRTVLDTKVGYFSFLWCHWHFLRTEAGDINRGLQMEQKSRINMKTVSQRDTHTHTFSQKTFTDEVTRQPTSCPTNKQTSKSSGFTCFYCSAVTSRVTSSLWGCKQANYNNHSQNNSLFSYLQSLCWYGWWRGGQSLCLWRPWGWRSTWSLGRDWQRGDGSRSSVWTPVPSGLWGQHLGPVSSGPCT